MCGCEMNVAVFARPTLNKQPFEVHTPARAAFPKLFGRIMPFWMAISSLLNLLLLPSFEHSNRFVWRIDASELTIPIAAVGFSLIRPVPINNRIARWAPDSLPRDRHVQEHLWDVYHWLRTLGLIAAFLLLAFGLALH